MTRHSEAVTRHAAVILAEDNDQDRRMLAALRADPEVEHIDVVTRLRAEAADLPPATHRELDESPRWAYFPWRRTVVGVLGRRAHQRLRLDRNRNLITEQEQDRLSRLRIGVVGLSVGHVVAHTLAAQGLCGELRLADPDVLELSNLNRVPATVLDLGVNKAVVAARRIAELDPYLPVQVLSHGIDATTIDAFLDGLDLVVEECDSFDAKVLIRERARARGLPVLMATSDRGLLDVERFDLDRSRPLLHGLLGDIDAATPADLTSEQKVAYGLRLVDPAALSSRMASSLVEIGETLTTWPQLAGEVTLGAAAVAEAVRRIGLGDPLRSGRVRIDLRTRLDEIRDPLQSSTVVEAVADTQVDGRTQMSTGPGTGTEVAEVVVAAAAARAPSGGNVQPWHIEVQTDTVRLRLATEATTAMDVGHRASAVALGAAVFNARVAAAAHHRAGDVTITQVDDPALLSAVVQLGDRSDPEDGRHYGAMLRRETNRRLGAATPIAGPALRTLTAAAQAEGSRLRLLTGTEQLVDAAQILSAADRIRYLTPRLHREMFSELRLPGDPDTDSGIDVRTLELSTADLMTLNVLRRPEVMAHLAQWDGGTALGRDTYRRTTSSAALGVVTVTGGALPDYLRGGSAMEAVWTAAEEQRIAVQPVSPVFLYAHNERELEDLSAPYARVLGDLRSEFRALTETAADEYQVLVLRFSIAPRPSVRSRRRPPPSLEPGRS